MYVQYDIRYTHCHFCISTVDLNGSPSNSNPSKHTQVPSVEFIHIYWSNITAFTQGFPLHLPCRAHGPSSHWAAFQSHWPAGQAANRQPMGERQMRNASHDVVAWKELEFWCMKVALNLSVR